jgi:hypothetical protein
MEGQGGCGILVSLSSPQREAISDRICRLFAIFRKARGLPAVKVGNDGKEQPFVSTLGYGGLSY